ncbi:MAG: peptidase M50, partial [Gammaproteobacteria bacterium]
MVAPALSGAEGALFERLAERRPRLRDSVEVHRHRYRGQVWFILRDAATGRWQRISASAYRVLRLLDGKRTLRAVLAAEGATAGIDASELVRVVDQVHQAEMIDWGLAPDAESLHARAESEQRRRRLARLLSPVAMRVPLMDPDRFLDARRGVAEALFSATAAVIATVVLALAGIALVLDWHTVTGYWQARGLASHAFVLLPLTYLVVKTVHELAHALAVKRWGGEVHDLGIVFLLLMPIPYVDASAAWAFGSKYRRMLVGAAGILCELVIAALAMLVFFLVEPGMVKDFAYTAMVLGSVSTLLFNGNPLLRFDGYYVLADFVEIPNLAPRASRYWLYLVQRYAFGLEAARSPVAAAGERRWFVIYGALAFCYRIFIVLGIAMLVAEVVPALGVALAVWVVIGQIGWPLARGVLYVLRAPVLAARRGRAVAVAAAGVGGTAVLLATLPAPLSTRAEGIVWLPEHAHVRASADGHVAELLHATHGPVAPGAPL